MNKVFFHRADYDGKLAGYFLWEGGKNKIIGMDYPDDITSDLAKLTSEPADRYEKIIFTDYIFEPFSIIEDLANSGKKIVLIDHHTSVINHFTNNPHPNIETFFPDDKYPHLPKAGQSAAYLAWMYVNKDTTLPLPDALKFISLYDTWQHGEDSQILSFMLGILSENFTAKDDRWEMLLEINPGEAINTPPVNNFIVGNLVNAGRYIQNFEDSFSKAAVSDGAFIVNLHGKKFKALNTNKRGSLQFERGTPSSSTEEVDGFLVFCLLKDGTWRYSLYAPNNKAENTRCDLIAESFGGGGHKGAAGFQTANLISEITDSFSH